MMLQKRKEIINKKFLKQGYIIFDIKSKKELNFIKTQILKISKKYFEKKNLKINKTENVFDDLQRYISVEDLNNFRLYIYNNLNKIKNFKKIYYELAENYLNEICGNELCMQNKINLSIQLPNDDSSLLPIHSDVWSGNSPFEVVLWIPLVNCFNTKSMFIMSPKMNSFYYKNINKFKTSDKIFMHSKKKLKWLNIKFGQGLIFTQNILHGNTVNLEKSTRWSFNCRFKSVFSPYKDKKIGEFFEPITLRAQSKIGMDYKFPIVK
jgi:sporadic carbohydrate cluster 2OG-Fe(II) oxygenase